MKRLFLSFFSAMLLLGCSCKPYVIIQVADAQLGFHASNLSSKTGTPYVNDLSFESEYLRKAVSLINELSPDVVVFTGDQVHRSDDQEQWDALKEIVSEINDDIKVYHLPGNHDIICSEGKVDSTPFTDRFGADRFLHCEAGVRIVGINTNLVKNNDPSEYEQFEWMKAALKKESPAEVSLVFGHHPYFITDIDEPDSYFPIMSSKRRLYFDMFAEMSVDAVYAGHLHDSSSSEFHGIPMKTATSVAFQLGKSKPSIRVITVDRETVVDELVEL